MQEEKEEHQEELEESGTIGEEDPSLVEDQAETEEAEPDEEEAGESESAEEIEEESVIEEAPPRRHGCLRGCVTPILAILVIILIAVMIVQSRRDTLREILLVRIVSNIQNQVLPVLPEDTDEEAMRAKFEEVKAAVKENRIDEEALTEAIEEYYQDSKQKGLLKSFDKYFGKYIQYDKLPSNLNIPQLLAGLLSAGDKESVGDFTWRTMFVGGMHFQDLYNYDIERVKRCSVHYATPDGRIIPFCAYNGGPFYREEVEKKFSVPISEWRGRKVVEDW